eukprot:IDg3342t1
MYSSSSTATTLEQNCSRQRIAVDSPMRSYSSKESALLPYASTRMAAVPFWSGEDRFGKTKAPIEELGTIHSKFPQISRFEGGSPLLPARDRHWPPFPAAILPFHVAACPRHCSPAAGL